MGDATPKQSGGTGEVGENLDALYRRLRPGGHGAMWENMRPFLVAIGSTALSCIAAYVLAQDSIDAITSG
ncbi:MAG TPA: hypothetical protein VKB76_10605 [Ktedonobacterales bacterium]|nr:hypothetical protein [Ktedonobacterales bacterium]